MELRIKNLLKIKKSKMCGESLWHLGIIAFLCCFVVILALNFCLFSGFQKDVTSGSELKNFSAESIESDLLDYVFKSISERDAIFEKYKHEIPRVKDPSF